MKELPSIEELQKAIEREAVSSKKESSTDDRSFQALKEKLKNSKT